MIVPKILRLEIFTLKKEIPTTITKRGVSEFKMEASELSILFSIAIANRNAGNKLPKKPVRAIKWSLRRDTFLKLRIANGRKNKPAEKMRTAPS